MKNLERSLGLELFGNPFYIWHQTVIVVVACFVLGWPMGPWAKFAVISAISLVLTVALCEAVGLTPLTRRLFGMKPSGAAPAARG
ncbi:MAG TPA: hypothetical protein VFG27_05495 [Pseudomonadales bacterium]|nr:hypothetical protein [Pseudomonadales bacterium]